MVEFSAKDKADCAKREVAMRRRVYGHSGLTPARAREIAMMEAIEADYRKVADEEEAKGRLI